MSLRDDFLEALQSVKRDFFGDSHESRPAEAVAANPPAAGKEHKPLHFDGVEGDEAPAKTVPDEVVYEAFKQASSLDDEEDGIHSSASMPYRDFEPPLPAVNGYGGSNGNGADDGRRVFDFEDGGVFSDDKTVISKNTVIRGALQTEDSLRLLGQILGDIECKSNVVLAGKVRGNTTAANAYIFDAQVDGDVRCDDVVNISSDAWILGNIRAQQAEVDGKIKGNIEIRHALTIGSTSSILGDISTDELEIKRGAFINGQIMMYSPSRDVIDRFDRFEE